MSRDAFAMLVEELVKRPGEVYITPDEKLILMALPNGAVMAITGDFHDATKEYISERVQRAIKGLMEF